MDNLKINVNPKDLKLLYCKSCNNVIFDQKTVYIEVPALVSGTGKPEVVAMALPVCTNCGSIPDKFLTEEITEALEKIKKDED